MRVIKTVTDRGCANSIRYLLSEAGIPSYLSGTNSHSSEVKVWVYFDSQYENACRLLENPGLRNTCPVDVNEFLR